MLQYLLTGLAGIALGMVAMRLWQSRSTEPAFASEASETPTDAVATAASPQSRKLLLGAGALLVAGIGVIALKSNGSDDAVAPSGISAPSGAAGAANSKALDDVDTMIQRLADRLEKNPTDGEGFRMLGWSYVMTGHPDKAITAYKRALALLPNQSNVHAGYGEALVGIAKGTVTQEAKDAFDKATKADPAEPRARYFQALWLAQHGNEKDALEQWIALAKTSPADAPWLPDLRQKITDTASKLGVDVAKQLPAAGAAATTTLGAPPVLDSGTVQAASALPATDRAAMVDQMVEGLANKLKTNPKDADGWVRLLRSRMVLKQTEQAGRDLAIARQALAGSADKLAMVNSAAKEFGVPDK